MTGCKMFGMITDTDIVQSCGRLLKKTWNDHLMNMTWFVVCIASHTAAKQLSGKSAQSITNTQTFVHENLNQHFSAPEEFKNTPANLPQSANTVVKLTGLPDFLHTLKKKRTCHKAPGMNELKMSRDGAHNRWSWFLDVNSLQSGQRERKNKQTL